MGTKIFIDGQAGTTGLGIAERLRSEAGFRLVELADTHRKDHAARVEAMAEADVTVLCLPDDAAREAVSLAPSGTRILDASTAHRTAPNWVYGFAELAPSQGAAIAGAQYVANPGCYATGAIALIKPLTDAGILKADSVLTLNAVSGFSGGGKAMIAEHEIEGGPAFELYALGLKHKHIPEIMAYGGLTATPIFVPAVGHFAQGMLVCLPLHLDVYGTTPEQVAEVYADYYGDQGRVRPRGLWSENLRPEALNGTDDLEIFIAANKVAGQAVLIARLDNLGKGASGAAVQNLKLMRGL
jgi:N-acetyl-gamma-glutamyl-phosphate reductase